MAKLNNKDLLIAKLDYQIATKELNIEKASYLPRHLSIILNQKIKIIVQQLMS